MPSKARGIDVGSPSKESTTNHAKEPPVQALKPPASSLSGDQHSHGRAGVLQAEGQLEVVGLRLPASFFELSYSPSASKGSPHRAPLQMMVEANTDGAFAQAYITAQNGRESRRHSVIQRVRHSGRSFYDIQRVPTLETRRVKHKRSNDHRDPGNGLSPMIRQ